MFWAVVLFIIGLVMLVKGGDWFVDGATAIAHKYHVPEIIIGATIVSIGTTLPEVMVSSTAALSGHGETAYGNAVGSIICNTSLIAALTMAIMPGPVDTKSLKVPVVFFFGAAAFYGIIAYTMGGFSRAVGIILLLMFVAYMAYAIYGERGNITAQTDGADEQPIKKQLIMLVVGAALIAFGARLLVDNGTIIAEGLGVPESVIAVTFVALGTSLPELVTAITSLIKGHSSLSLGNIVGANLFNLVLVSGVATTLQPFALPSENRTLSLAMDIPLTIFVMAFMTIPALKRGKVARWQGVTLLAVYAAYVIVQFSV